MNKPRSRPHVGENHEPRTQATNRLCWHPTRFATGFLCALCACAVIPSFSDFPPPFLCALCVKSFDLLQQAQRHYPHAPIQENKPRNRNQTPHHQHPHNPAHDQIPRRKNARPSPRTKHALRHPPIRPPAPRHAPPSTHRNSSRPQDAKHPQRASNPHIQSSPAPAAHEETAPVQRTCRTRTSSRQILPPKRGSANLPRFPPSLPLRQIPHQLPPPKPAPGPR